MIVDHLNRANRWEALHPLFPRAFDWLQAANANWNSIENGKIVLLDPDLFVLASSDTGRGPERSPLEFHHRYIDIQFVISGSERIGWSYLPADSPARSVYQPDRDIGFLAEPATTWLALEPGQFAVFFPTDSHAPLAGHGPVRKAVVKVALDPA